MASLLKPACQHRVHGQSEYSWNSTCVPAFYVCGQLLLCPCDCCALQARKLGMWSSAVELINEREKATEKRLAKLQDGARTGGCSQVRASLRTCRAYKGRFTTTAYVLHCARRCSVTQ